MNDNNKSGTTESITLQGSWILVNHIEEAEEATALNPNELEGTAADNQNDQEKKTENGDSDLESDGISVISDTQLLDSNTDDEIPVKKDDLSDSSSTKWTFVEDAKNAEEPSNKFYLNCEQEPVQELSEQELGSISSDLESDSVSIISETDDYLQDAHNISTVIDNQNPVANRFECLDLRKYCNLVVLSTVSLALISFCLSPYFANSNIADEDVTAYSEQNINNVKNYEIVDPVIYCREKHKNDGIYSEVNAKKCRKCLKKAEKNKGKPHKKSGKLFKGYNKTDHESFLKMKEEYLKQKEEFLIQRENELYKAENNLRKRKINVDNDKPLRAEEYKKKLKKEHKTKSFEKQDKKKYEPKENNDVKYHKKGDFGSKEFKTRDQKFKVPRNDEDKNHDKQKYKDPKVMNDKKKYKKDDHNYKLKKGEKNYNIHYKSSKFNKTDGEWFNHLHKGRFNIRRTQRESDWVFDRATFRSQRRNKAIWYFQWMGNRETNRFKKFSH